ncbi:MAG: 3-methyl-2-oxobutanoate dehydrogenase subunit beta [Euryarchaeota archaeon]|nr:3-methyl-2-oxobutanoate dehydrogenase subunit beta [Euryarchaeota archaeon]
MKNLTIPEEEYMLPGHTACLGCGATLAMRYALKALGKNTIITIPACCWAVIPGVYPSRALEVPLLYTAFEVTGAAVSGIREALSAKGIEDVNVVGFAGDGGTADIGIQSLSGAVERGEDIFYIMYDNEAYMNTGIQRSSSTPKGAWTTTTQVGKIRDWKKEKKKNMVEIMAAHGIPYTATASIAFPEDFIKKLEKGKKIKGPKFYQVFSTCPTGWLVSPNKSVEVARLAVESKIFPLYEVENGVYNITYMPKKEVKVKDYFSLQGRFRHLTEDEIREIQNDVDEAWKILVEKEKWSKSLMKVQ